MAPATANSLLLSTISLQIYILLIRTSPPDWIDRHIRCKYIFMPTKNLVPSSNLMLGFVVVVLLLTKEDTRTSEPIVVFDAASLAETARIGFWWCHWSHVLQTQALCLVLFVCVVACLPAQFGGVSSFYPKARAHLAMDDPFRVDGRYFFFFIDQGRSPPTLKNETARVMLWFLFQKKETKLREGTARR